MSGLCAGGIAMGTRFGPVNLSLDPGSLTLLIGPNGAGKTTLFHALIGHHDARGTVMIGGEHVAAMPPALRMRRLAFLPASRDIGWPVTARDLVTLGLAPGLDSGLIDQALDRIDGHGFADRAVNSLSTGERTRILIARALVSQPDVILLDEPLANLDPAWRLRVLALMGEEAARGAAVLVSVHDLMVARHHSGRIIMVDQGSICADGQADEVMTDALLSRIFGVRLTDHGMELA